MLVSVVAVSVFGFAVATSDEASAAFADAALSVSVAGLASWAAGSALIVESGGFEVGACSFSGDPFCSGISGLSEDISPFQVRSSKLLIQLRYRM